MTHWLFSLFQIISNILTSSLLTFSVNYTFYFYIAFEELTFYQKCSIKYVLYSLFYTAKFGPWNRTFWAWNLKKMQLKFPKMKRRGAGVKGPLELFWKLIRFGGATHPLPSSTNDDAIFFARQLGLMFLRFFDWSSDAMFAIYRSSLEADSNSIHVV